MNDRKQHVIEMAHKLFIEKGFQSTTIQDILEYSGISKGTFYNYFLSKNELIMAIFKTLFNKMEIERDEILVGEDSSDPEIFMKQIELQMKTNRANKLIPLFEEVFFSNDDELKQFLEAGQMRTLRWIYDRLSDLFPGNYHPYLLDGAIMLKGVLQQNIRYYSLTHGSNANIEIVIRYSVSRVLKMVEEAAESGEVLHPSELMETWLPNDKKIDQGIREKLCQTIYAMKIDQVNDEKHTAMLDFIQEELLQTKPRKFLIDSVLLSLAPLGRNVLEDLERIVEEFFQEGTNKNPSSF